jgi:glycine/D-amino acid oxidase-like deaminating enzyme
MSGEPRHVAVIGGGIFGIAVAMELGGAGYRVTLVERQPSLLMGTSKNNTNRVHRGFHYPRDLSTAIECRDSFERFTADFSGAILDGFSNLYCIAADGSRTSIDEYLGFCDRAGLSYRFQDLARYATEIRGCELALLCGEAVCDSEILRTLLVGRLRQSGRVECRVGTEVVGIERRGSGYDLYTGGKGARITCDAVVNCSYADINRLSVQLGHDVPERQYEYTVVPVVELALPPQGITIMDGPFMTLLPFGRTGQFTLYHVVHSVIACEVSTTINPKWLDVAESPFRDLDPVTYFEHMREACSEFAPRLREGRLVRWLEAPRMVLAGHDEDDARPSMLQDLGSGYFVVFSGKIDRCLGIAEAVRASLASYFTKGMEE